MNWIYLSPHFDDAVFSCGGLIWEQARYQDEPQIWTICAGDIPTGGLSSYAQEHHQRWKTGWEAVAQRKREDLAACRLLGVRYRHLNVPDCIYRREGDDYWAGKANENSDGHLYASNEAIFGPLHPAESDLVSKLGSQLGLELSRDAELVCPLTIGGHVDHRLTRAAAETLDRPMWYYPDFPYVLDHPNWADEWITQGWERQLFEVSQAGLEAWFEAATAYESQVSTFWSDLFELRETLVTYHHDFGGVQMIRLAT